MGLKQLLLAGAGILLVVLLYFVGDTTPRKESKGKPLHEQDVQSSSFDLNNFRDKVFTGMPVGIRDTLLMLEDFLAESKDSSERAVSLISLMHYCDSTGLPVLGAEYYFAYADLTRTALAWESAGDHYMDAMLIFRNDSSTRSYLYKQSLTSYRKAREIDPDNDELIVKEAELMMEKGDEVMQGVQMLLGIVEEDPDNISANLVLGRFGLISGQYNKAIERLEKVVSLDTQNAEGYFYLAEAYNGIGEVEKAIEMFEICKTLIDNPAFSQEIDMYIDQIKER